jgi:tRNA(Leu) C34 or U34 (ribose-2'-O)-methylase TrmL
MKSPWLEWFAKYMHCPEGAPSAGQIARTAVIARANRTIAAAAGFAITFRTNAAPLSRPKQIAKV